MKIIWIGAAILIVALTALWLWEPWIVYSLVIGIWAGVLALVAHVLNLIVPADEKHLRVEARVFVDGAEHRAAGVATCRRRFETYGIDGHKLARRLRISGGHVTVALPDRRMVQSSAFLVCSEDEFAKLEDRDRIAFYLIDRRALPIRTQYTSIARSNANPAAPFRVSTVSAKPTDQAHDGGPAYLPGDLFAGPHAIEDVKYALTSYVALAIPRELWSTDEKLRAAYSEIGQFRVVAKPPNDVLRRLVEQSDAWPASGVLMPDHSRVDLPAFGAASPVGHVAITTAPWSGHGARISYPLPQICLAQSCVTMPASPSERESVHSRQGYFFDPDSRRLIMVRAVYASMLDPGRATFEP